MKLGFDSEKKNGKKYYFITLCNRGFRDDEVSTLFKITLDEYVEILTATGGYKEDGRGYIFNDVEDVENAIVTLKILLEEP